MQSCCYGQPGGIWEWSLSVSVLMEIPQGRVICSGLLSAPLGRVFPCRVSQSRLCFAMFPRWSVSLSHLFAYWAPEVTLAKLSSPCPAGKGNWERKDNEVSCLGAEDGGSSTCEQNWEAKDWAKAELNIPAQVPCWDNVEYQGSEMTWLPCWASFLPANAGMKLESLYREAKVDGEMLAGAWEVGQLTHTCFCSQPTSTSDCHLERIQMRMGWSASPVRDVRGPGSHKSVPAIPWHAGPCWRAHFTPFCLTSSQYVGSEWRHEAVKWDPNFSACCCNGETYVLCTKCVQI